MAQKREKEETELKVSETLTLHTPSISVTDRRSSPEISDLKSGVNGVTVDFRPTSTAVPENETSDSSRKRRLEAVETSACTSPKRRVVNRCLSCKRKVGLIGFRCRCGDMFCSEHRYSDRHDCSYDYKAAGREAIARENPVVRAAKILKV